MKYDQITDVKQVKKIIQHCFEHLCKEDQQRFVKKLHKQSDNFDQEVHTLMELVLGAYLSSRSRGFEVRYEYLVGGKTPDWCILDRKSAVIGVVELVNFHRDEESENEIDQGHAVWSRVNKNNDRLYDGIRHKMQYYKALVEKLITPYIVAICPDWRAGMDFERLLPCLHNSEDGLFPMYPGVSGVLYFDGNLEQYSFTYEQNPYALRKFDLPSGVFLFAKDNGFSS